MNSQEIYLRSKIESHLISKGYLHEPYSIDGRLITKFIISNDSIQIHINEKRLIFDKEPDYSISQPYNSLHFEYVNSVLNVKIHLRGILVTTWLNNLRTLERHLIDTIVDVLGTGGDLYFYKNITVNYEHSTNIYIIELKQDLSNHKSLINKITPL